MYSVEVVTLVAVALFVVFCAPVEARHALHKSNSSVGPDIFVVENLKSKPSATGECRRIHAVPRDIARARLDRSWDDNACQAAATRKSTGLNT
jgi:hypothetical protein